MHIAACCSCWSCKFMVCMYCRACTHMYSLAMKLLLGTSFSHLVTMDVHAQRSILMQQLQPVHIRAFFPAWALFIWGIQAVNTCPCFNCRCIFDLACTSFMYGNPSATAETFSCRTKSFVSAITDTVWVHAHVHGAQMPAAGQLQKVSYICTMGPSAC